MAATSRWIRRALAARVGRPVALVALLGATVAFWVNATPAAAPSRACPAGRLMNVVAHEDDDLLFLSPDLLNAISAGECVRTVFLTAGDAANGIAYWQARQQGSQAAYAEMAGVRDRWSRATQHFAGNAVEVDSLIARPTISLAFLRLPDGTPDGSGNTLYHNESLQKLYRGSDSAITTVDGSATYTRSGLVAALVALMTTFRPTVIHTQDFAGRFGDGDHSDHHATAYFARLASRQYRAPHLLVGFEGYGVARRPPNVFATALTAKARAFESYARYDKYVCRPWKACTGTTVARWTARQYVVGTIPARRPGS